MEFVAIAGVFVGLVGEIIATYQRTKQLGQVVGVLGSLTVVIAFAVLAVQHDQGGDQLLFGSLAVTFFVFLLGPSWTTISYLRKHGHKRKWR